MSDNNLGSANAGSPAGSVNSGSPIDQEQYKNLEKALGTQGQELGDLRQFFADISPLLEKLDQNPELVQAIVENKIDAQMAKAVMEGKVTFGDAQIVSAANAEVKKELGASAYNNSDPKAIEKLIEDRISAVKAEMAGNLKDVEDTRAFEAQVADFISRTPDFTDYAKEIDAWLDSHDIADVEVAYYAVKGKLSEKNAKKLADEAAGEAAKNVAMNAGGGATRVSFSSEGGDTIDSMISGKSNPNIFRK